MGQKGYFVPGPGEEVKINLPNGIVLTVWTGVLEEANLVNIRANDAIVIQPVTSNFIVVRKRD